MKLIKTAFVAIPAAFLIACDSNPETSNVIGDIARSPEAQSLALTEYLTGDAFRYNSATLPNDPDVIFPDSFASNPETIPEGDDPPLVVAGDTLEINTVSFEYEVFDAYGFIWRGFPDTRIDLEAALRAILGSPGLLNSEFRDLMLKTELDLVDRQRIVEIIRRQNVDVRLLSDGTIIGLEQIIVYHRIESKNKHLLEASMFGRYTIEERFFKLKFELATQEQIDEIRLLTPSHHVPFPDSVDNFVIEDFQVGIWNCILENQNVTQVNPNDIGTNPGETNEGVGGAGSGEQ